MWLKGWLFLVIGLLSAAMLLVEHWSWRARHAFPCQESEAALGTPPPFSA